ncbi:2'-5' RNA ligase family protein [Streptomyces syringium]|uniref:2'-5' RNA ligase family protein n=1 Tax=Streptomyces syringium TaxID=76729 RepID=UPI00342E42C9
MDDFFAGLESRSHPWTAGRWDLHWHLMPSASLAWQLAIDYRKLTHRDGIAPVAPAWLHVTVARVGVANDISKHETAAIIEYVGEVVSAIKPFDLILDRPSIGQVAIECAGRPGAPARSLWELTAGVSRQILGDRFPQPSASYAPHLSLGYGIAGPSRPDRAAMKAWLSDHPGEPVSMHADRLVLVSQCHDRRSITWERLAEVPLRCSASDSSSGRIPLG